MEKLELKHVAPYLPYGLKMKCYDHEYELFGVDLAESTITLEDSNGGYDQYGFGAWKPILRPLSDLTKEIEVSGENFVPIQFLNDKALGLVKYRLEVVSSKLYLLMDFRDGYNSLSENSAKSKLIEWHFDAFGLIDKGLAIDINTL